jgi:hypothetical protein
MERGRERGERGGGVRETYRERKRAAEMKRGIAWRASLHRCARAAKPTRMPSLSYTVLHIGQLYFEHRENKTIGGCVPRRVTLFIALERPKRMHSFVCV